VCVDLLSYVELASWLDSCKEIEEIIKKRRVGGCSPTLG
jgi:hypothetical protein